MTRVKICGLTEPADARLAAELGAWAIGLVFHQPSPRACTLEAAEEIGALLKRSTEVVGVFVNAPLEELSRVAERCSLTLLQLHGDEGPAYCAEAARRTGCKVMKAVRAKDSAVVRGLQPFHVDYHMLDAHVPGLRGGTGETLRWELAAAHDRAVPLVLSGGLEPGNVAAAIREVRPWAVDTASGTEAAPGRKDPEKVRAFIREVALASEREPA